jgi:RimK family alpha-L-glutamate ligase
MQIPRRHGWPASRCEEDWLLKGADVPPVRVLGSTANETTVELVRNWRALGYDAMLVSSLDLAQVPSSEVVLGRLDILPTLDGVEDGLLALLRLERCGVSVLNRARALAAAHDKLLTARLLERAGLPHPRTAAMRAGDAVPLSPPLVLKPRCGSWGRDVLRCRDSAELDRALALVHDRSWFRSRGAVVQELLEPRGYDHRLVVARGEVIAAGQRIAAEGEWRTNISLGGRLRPLAPTDAARSLATKAAAALGADFIGVDLMPVNGGYAVLELNGAVDFDERYAPENDVYLKAAQALGIR